MSGESERGIALVLLLTIVIALALVTKQIGYSKGWCDGVNHERSLRGRP